jgi:transcriptional regulator with XRE-family HTH domain
MVDNMGERLRELRKQKNLTQEELGKKVSLSASTIGMYEQGRRKPDYSTLVQLCDIFHVSISYIITGNEDVDPDKLIDLFMEEDWLKENLSGGFLNLEHWTEDARRELIKQIIAMIQKKV